MRNQAPFIVVLLAVVALFVVGTADAQRLLRSEPANGACGVDPAIGVIRLHFDCDMLTDSFTVVDAKEGPFPPVAGDNSRPWKGPRLFVLSIGKLEQGKTYALQLNSPTRTGFQSADRKPLPVTVVTFTVDRKVGPGGEAPAGPQGLAGPWQTKDKGMTYVLQANGNYTLEIRDKDKVSRYAGRWSIEGETMIFTDAAKNHAQRRFQWKREALNAFRLYFTAGDSFVVHRIGKFGGGTQPPRGKGALVGTWLAKDDTGSAKIVFSANGRYTREFAFAGETGSSSGTWKIDGQKIVVHDDKEDEALDVPFAFPDRDTLRLTIEGDTIQLRRQGAKVNRPAQLIGQWQAKDETGSMTLTLGADGRHRMTMHNPQQHVDFQGEWRVEGQTLVLENQQNGRALRMAFQPVQGGLTVDIQGTKIQLKKTR